MWSTWHWTCPLKEKTKALPLLFNNTWILWWYKLFAWLFCGAFLRACSLVTVGEVVFIPNSETLLFPVLHRRDCVSDVAVSSCFRCGGQLAGGGRSHHRRSLQATQSKAHLFYPVCFQTGISPLRTRLICCGCFGAGSNRAGHRGRTRRRPALQAVQPAQVLPPHNQVLRCCCSKTQDVSVTVMLHKWRVATTNQSEALTLKWKEQEGHRISQMVTVCIPDFVIINNKQ